MRAALSPSSVRTISLPYLFTSYIDLPSASERLAASCALASSYLRAASAFFAAWACSASIFTYRSLSYFSLIFY